MQDTPASLIDIEQIAAHLGKSPADARGHLAALQDPPVATYRGRELWLSETLHDAVTA